MFTYLVDEISTVSDGNNNQLAESGKSELETSIDELASLRFSIILTARFADSPTQTRERREELHARLASLRRQYSEKIDEIAMTLSVQAAMDAKEEVERTVAVPRGVSRSALAGDAGINRRNQG